MAQRGLSSRIIGTVSVLAAATAMVVGSSAGAQKPPADLTVLPPTPTDYTPKKTSWGDWDFTGTWPIENIASTRILFQRQKTYGNRIWVTKEEHDKRIANATRSDGSYNPEGGLNAGGTQGLADWVKNSDYSWRTSMLVKPADGQHPPGEIVAGKNAVVVGTGTAAVRLGEVQAVGRRPMSAAEWARGQRLEGGEVLR